MTERKPPDVSFASWIDQQVNEAAQRGAFDNLPGAGKPIPRRGEADDGQAWLRDYLRREGVSAEELLPAPLRLRKEIERLTATVRDLRSEREVRELVTGLNQRIMEWRLIPVGPPVYLRLVDEETMVARWREARPRPSSQAPAGPGPASPPRRWWHRRGHGRR
jgi:DnaJ homologue, subfamily C, member 28, conserved domain